MSEFVADIKDNGLKDPITILNGQILDGRNRYMACGIAGVEPRYVEFAGNDPIAFVVSANIHRRHLTPIQLAALANTIANMEHGGDRRSNQAAPGPIGKISQAGAAEMTGASQRTMRRLKHIKSHDEELHKNVIDGVISTRSAKKIIDLKNNKTPKPNKTNKKIKPSLKDPIQQGVETEPENTEQEKTNMRLDFEGAIQIINEMAIGIPLPRTEPDVMNRLGCNKRYTACATLAFIEGYKYGSKTSVIEIQEQLKKTIYAQVVKDVQEKVNFADSYRPSFAQSKYGLTKDQYNFLLKCFHPDATHHIKDETLTARFSEAFQILKNAKEKLVPPEKLILKASPLPSTGDELEALIKARMQKHNKPKNKTMESKDEDNQKRETARKEAHVQF